MSRIREFRVKWI